MRDKRPVDELTIEELERILAMRKREARRERMRRYEARRINNATAPPVQDEESEVNDQFDEEAVDAAEQTPNALSVRTTALRSERADRRQRERTTPIASDPDRSDDDSNIPQFEDELDARRVQGARPEQSNLSKLLWNRALLVIEIAAALGLIYLAYSLFTSLQEVTQVSASIQAQYQATANAKLVLPTATPVINVQSVVLPVGHTVQINDKGEVRAAFNLDEVPAQYRAQFQALVNQPPPQPTASPEGPIRIQISKIKVDSTVVTGDSWQALQLGVGHHIGSANPGERGNIVLSGHNDVYGEVFRHLDQLQQGDTIVVSSTSRDYTYVVRERQLVRPDAVWVMESRGDERQLTLISCYPYRVDTQRIVIFATLQE